MHDLFSVYTGMGTDLAYTLLHCLVKYFHCQFVHMLRMFDLSSDVDRYSNHCCVFANH